MEEKFLLLNICLLFTWFLEPAYRHYEIPSSLRFPVICSVLTHYVIVDVTSSAQMLKPEATMTGYILIRQSIHHKHTRYATHCNGHVDFVPRIHK